MKASAKDRKSWFTMPKVPTSWWRNSMPPSSAEETMDRDKSPEPRAKSESLQISAPIIQAPAEPADPIPAPRAPLCPDIAEENDPEYMNTVSCQNSIDEEGAKADLLSTCSNANTEKSLLVREEVETKLDITPVCSEVRMTEMCLLRGVPNISFSFFPDNDLIFSSAHTGSAKDSLERATEQLGSNVSAAGENYENINEESNARMDCLESVEKGINLDIRSEICDGSSYENIKDFQSSSSSDYQSIVDQSLADFCVDDSGFQSDVKTYESEYSIFIGKSVEIFNDSIVSPKASEDVPMKGDIADIESPYASPRNSAISVSVVDDSTSSECTQVAKETGEQSNQSDDFYSQITPRLFELSNKQLNDCPAQNDNNKELKSIAKASPPKTTKSLTDLTFKSSDSVFKSLKLAYKSESSSPKLTPRTETIKLSDKYEKSPPKTLGKLNTSSSSGHLKDKSTYQNQDRPPGPPPLPPVDWNDSLTVNSSPSTAADDENYEDVEEFDYCKQRAKTRRSSLSRSSRNKSPGLVRVKSRLGRVVRAVSGWWCEERVKLGEVIQKHAHAQAVGALGADRNMCESEEKEEEFEEGDADATDGIDGAVAGIDVTGCERDASESVNGSEKATPSVIVKRRQRKLGRPTSRSGLIRSRYFPEGQNGFEELRRFIKQGGDFCKDLSSILQERSEAESQYAKSLSKLSGKLLKASKDSVGTVNQAWQQAGTEMEEQSEIHRAFAAALSEEVVKPLRQMVESQHRVRKTVEAAVDKTGKSLSEWRAAETKSKKQSFMSARENEKMQDAMLDVRLSRAGSTHTLHHAHSQKIVSDKESAKLDSKRRKAEDAVKKADVEYYTFCIRAERARLEWETAVIRGSHCFQAIEEERLQNLKDIASCYLQHLQEMGPKMVECTDRLGEPVTGCDVSRDIQTVVSIKGTGQPIPEQLLPDFYAEHITLAMNRERRRNALVKLLQLVRQDIERERRGKQGVENLARALQETPTFGTEDSQQNVTEKLHHMRSMLTYLEAARYKVQSALAELDGRARGPHPLASHIQVTRDRQGLQQSILKVPPWVRKESIDRMAGDSPDWTDRGAADGNSVQPDSDFDEFSSQGSEKDYQSSILTYPVISECSESPSSCGMNGQCKALYEYSANLYDELNLRPGDVINIHDKQPDGWWLGELNGVVGIFPATYVEEMK